MTIDLAQVPNWFMALAVVVLCGYTGLTLKERNDDFKNALLEIFGRLGTVEKKQEHLEGEHTMMKSMCSGGRRADDPTDRP